MTAINWIPVVSGKRPAQYKQVLIGRAATAGNKTTLPGFWNGEHFYAVGIAETTEFVNATHWAEFPEAPDA
ncbi:hypothetical protein [Roseibium aggregatum]|uniref:DUF551 domain-containing protein n=1 Tax=Roseibium aggregatum TaxID=187304 RepID=A0A0M6Y6K8_9HYPH|nr:hypothetical protein [Roseibium aggregatum]CTQ45732.1 hypothetical protein LAL4801_04187 [Roseibium aggregatum]